MFQVLQLDTFIFEVLSYKSWTQFIYHHFYYKSLLHLLNLNPQSSYHIRRDITRYKFGIAAISLMFHSWDCIVIMHANIPKFRNYCRCITLIIGLRMYISKYQYRG
jgi:hypothetical protein